MGFEQIQGPNLFAALSSTLVNATSISSAILNASSIVNNVIASTGLSQTNTTGTVTLFANLLATTASLTSNQAIATTNLSVFAPGPTVAQGTSGTWFASGTVTCNNTSAACNFYAILWDGTSVIDSANAVAAAANFRISISLSGFKASPAGNLRIDVSSDNANSVIEFNRTGQSKDSTITAVRIAV